MLEKWTKVGEGMETEAERALNMLAMMDVTDEEKGEGQDGVNRRLSLGKAYIDLAF